MVCQVEKIEWQPINKPTLTERGVGGLGKQEQNKYMNLIIPMAGRGDSTSPTNFNNPEATNRNCRCNYNSKDCRPCCKSQQ